MSTATSSAPRVNPGRAVLGTILLLIIGLLP